MPDLTPLLTALAFAYGAAVAGLLAALIVRAWSCRRGRAPSAAEALWYALLPALAVLIMPMAAAFQPHAARSLAALHEGWHEWERVIHAAPVAHRTLHAANLLFLVGAAVCASHSLYALIRLRAFAAGLRAAAQPLDTPTEEGSLYRLPSPRPACFTVGVLRPAVYVTTGLLEQLTPRECEAALAHEAAHVRRRDGLTRSLLAAFYTLFPLPGSQTLRADWERAAEQECDAAAARRIGSPCDVARALVRVAQLAGATPPAVAAAAPFAASVEDIPGRVEALLSLTEADEARQAVLSSPGRWLMVVSLGLILAADFPIRHAVELFVSH